MGVDVDGEPGEGEGGAGVDDELELGVGVSDVDDELELEVGVACLACLAVTQGAQWGSGEHHVSEAETWAAW